MDERQADYLRKREAQEREAMALAADKSARQIHREMAERYAELAQRINAEDEVNGIGRASFGSFRTD